MSNYAIEGGKVLCKGEPIADYNPDNNTVTSEKALAPGIKGAINRLVEPNATFIVTSPPPESEPPPPDEPPLPVVETIPPPPEMEIGKGDKSPAYVEWYREHHTPEQFEAKYKSRNIQ